MVQLSTIVISVLNFLVALIAIAMMGVLLNNNSSALLNSFSRNVLILSYNATDIINHIPATLACQALLEERNAEYQSCISSASANCTDVSNRETLINAQVSLTNLTSTRNAIQWSCNNRTNNLEAELTSYVSGSSNTTIVQSGTMLITVYNASSFASNYTWKRTLLGDEFKLDILILSNWTVSINTATLDPIIIVNTFSPALCIYGNQKPLYDLSYFVGGTVTTHEETCTSITFQVSGFVSNLQLVRDFPIFF